MAAKKGNFTSCQKPFAAAAPVSARIPAKAKALTRSGASFPSRKGKNGSPVQSAFRAKGQIPAPKAPPKNRAKRRKDRVSQTNASARLAAIMQPVYLVPA